MPMPNILLIKSDTSKRTQKQKHLPKRFSYPLGIMYLAAVARRRWPGARIRIVDSRFERPDWKEIKDRFSPDLIGISALTAEATHLHCLAAEARSAGIRAPIVAGGPHASGYPKEVLGDPNFDLSVVGEGEETFLEILQRMDKRLPLRGIRGTAYRDDGKIHLAPPRPFIEDLDSLPFPAWDLVDVEAYCHSLRATPFGLARYMNIYTSRGCPYHCNYCHNINGKRFRARSPENVLEEIRRLQRDYRIHELEPMDDCLNLDRGRLLEICDGIIRGGIKIRMGLPNALRADILTDELITRLHRAGLYYSAFAIETASPRLQKAIHKHINLENLKAAVATAARVGIFCQGFFMLGFPTETREEMMTTIRFSTELALHVATFSIVLPFKGTEVYDTALALGRKTDFSYDEYDVMEGLVNVSELPDEELFRIHRLAYRRFYLRPRQIVRLFLRYPHKQALLQHTFEFLHRAFIPDRRIKKGQ